MPVVYVSEAIIGKVVAQNVIYEKTQDLLLKTGTILTNAMVSALKRRGIREVAIEESSSLFISPEDIIAIDLKNGIKRFIALYTSTEREANKTDSIFLVAQLSDRIIEEITLDKDILDFCVLLKITDKNLFFHSIAVCSLSILVGGVFLQDRESLINLAKGALLHDIGLIEIPYLINKTDRSAQEEVMWQEHVRYGYYLAKEKGIDEEICKLILMHHERWNGSGYPDHCKGEEILLGARIINVCNIYDNLSFKEGNPASEAIEFLYGAGGLYFDSQVVNALCDNLAVYPLGSLVQLNTGEIGVVINIRKNRGPRPIVRICFNRVNRPIADNRDVDLGTELTMFIKKVY